MYFFFIARESKSISEPMPSHLAYEKYSYAQILPMLGLSNVTHIWWLQCLMATVHLVRAGTIQSALLRGHCGFRLMRCHLCPSYGHCPWCSIQAVICPGGAGSSSRWHGRWWSEKLEKCFYILPRCPSSFTRALSSKGEGELDPCPPSNPSSRGMLPHGKQVMSQSWWFTWLLPAPTATTFNSLNPSASLLQLAMTGFMY